MKRALKDAFRTLFGILGLSGLIIAAAWAPAFAQKQYDTGVTDTEIKIGNIMPYSGPVSAYGVTGRAEAAYFRKINAEGGINGRKIRFISYDDAYSPPKAVEQARKLVERRSFRDLRPAGYAVQHRHSEVHAREEGAAAVRAERCRQME
jgi:branched-chain amino acid transport system substrate-binding protein